ncbi:hypothetical protein FQN54_008916 [Arachnomyces sp. PD_36]|nr:hypothetical protein FQN54_008916 [Arachnomyces sp. PD_36]
MADQKPGTPAIRERLDSVDLGALSSPTTWPPIPPDMSLDEVLSACEESPFSISPSSQLYRFNDGRQLVYKHHACTRELSMTKLAGACAIPIHARTFSNPDSDSGSGSGIQMTGFILPLETPLPAHCSTQLTPPDLPPLINKMISLIETLHKEHGLVHGDVKPSNMLLCSDGDLRLCDFAEARPIDEDPESWTGDVSVNYVSPNRSYYYPDELPAAPTVNDDLYALGLSIWEVCMGMVPFAGVYHDDIIEELKQGRTVDVDLIEGKDIRETVRYYLRLGGADI